MRFSEEQWEHYSRHIVLHEVGLEGQERIANAKVLIIGAGGLGSPAAMYLAAAGVGTIGIADGDKVDLSNLQRQILYMVQDIGTAKVQSAKEKLCRMNPDITVNTYDFFVNEETIMDMIKDYDIVIDATDNFDAKFLINDACVLAEKPFVHGGVLRFKGQLMTYVPKKGPCYRCIFKNKPPKGAVPTGSEAGVIGAICGIVGSLQAIEAIKYIIGSENLLVQNMLVCDAFHMEFRKVKLPERTLDCAVCGEHPTITRINSHQTK